jgi:DNA mismatch endonuclease (patch repair protein)
MRAARLSFWSFRLGRAKLFRTPVAHGQLHLRCPRYSSFLCASMADTLSPRERSVRMSLIRSKDTKPELAVRKALWAAGFRYRLHGPGLPGRPDLVLPGLRTVVFVHGCYWHGHVCQKGRIPEQNSGFWREKFIRNKARDKRNAQRLRREGWSVLTVWECSLATAKKRERAIRRVLDLLDRRRQDIDHLSDAKRRPMKSPATAA